MTRLSFVGIFPLSQVPGQTGEEEDGDQIKDELPNLVEWSSRKDDKDSSHHAGKNRAKDQRQPVTILPAARGGERSDDQQRQARPDQTDPERNQRRRTVKDRGMYVGQRDQKPPEKTEEERYQSQQPRRPGPSRRFPAGTCGR